MLTTEAGALPTALYQRGDCGVSRHGPFWARAAPVRVRPSPRLGWTPARMIKTKGLPNGRIQDIAPDKQQPHPFEVGQEVPILYPRGGAWWRRSRKTTARSSNNRVTPDARSAAPLEMTGFTSRARLRQTRSRQLGLAGLAGLARSRRLERFIAGGDVNERRARELVARERTRIEALLAEQVGEIRADGSLQRQQTGEYEDAASELDSESVSVALAERKVRFMEVAFGGFLGLGESKSLIPVEAITRMTPDAVYIGHTARTWPALLATTRPGRYQLDNFFNLYPYYVTRHPPANPVDRRDPTVKSQTSETSETSETRVGE